MHFKSALMLLWIALTSSVSGLVVTSPCCHDIPHRLSTLGGFTNSKAYLNDVETVFANPVHACDNNSNLHEWRGRMVVIERGICNFTSKILTAQSAGAKAVAIYNNKPSDRNGVLMTGDDLVSSMIEIPAIFVSKRSARVLEEARRLLSSEREGGYVVVTLNATGSYSPPKIELRGVEELTRYVIVIFLCSLLAFALGGLLVLLVTVTEQKWRSRAIRNLLHYSYRGPSSIPVEAAEAPLLSEYPARDIIKRFLTTAQEYSPEFVTYLVQHAGPSLLRELQSMAVLPIGGAVSSLARMMTSPITEELPPEAPKLTDSSSAIADEEPVAVDRVHSVAQSLMSVYADFASRMAPVDAGMRAASSNSYRMSRRAMKKLNSTVMMLRQILSPQKECDSDSAAEAPLMLLNSAAAETVSIPRSSHHCDVSCAICLDEIMEGNMVTELPCKHLYHRSCIEPWLESRSLECPLCKAQAIRRDASDAAIANILSPVVTFFTSTWCLLFLFGLAGCFLIGASMSVLLPSSILIPPGTVRVLPPNADVSGH